MATIGIGILGFGGFAMFAAQQFAQVPGAALRCIAGTHREASLACARRFGLADVQRAEVLFARPDVQLVYIATPPFLHHEQARDALRAGKHVIVESLSLSRWSRPTSSCLLPETGGSCWSPT